MIHLFKDKLKPNLIKNHEIFYQYYNSIYIENRQDIDCFKMLFLIKFKVYYNFINDNNDINYVTNSDCMNLTKVRETLNKFNDTFHHLNYIPIVIPPTDHLTYQIVTWIIFSIVLLTLIIIYVQCFFKKNNYKINEINPILCPIKNIIVNEIVISNNSNNIDLTLQTKAELEEINNLNEILNLEV
jgi:hypothetical protein